MYAYRRVRALHIFSINPQEISHPRLAHTIYNRPCPPAVLRVFFARAPAPSFPFLSPLGGRNRRFFALAFLVLELLSLKSSFLLSVRRSSTVSACPVHTKHVVLATVRDTYRLRAEEKRYARWTCTL